MATDAERALPSVTLVPITRENWLAAIALRVRPDQEAFVPSVPVSLAKVAIKPDGPEEEYRSFAVMADGTMVGFGQLVGQFGVSPTLWISGLLIDAAFQGQGFGLAAVLAFVELAASAPACREVGLTVEPHNEQARRLYRSLGFVDTGQMYDSELVHRLSLERPAAQ